MERAGSSAGVYIGIAGDNCLHRAAVLVYTYGDPAFPLGNAKAPARAAPWGDVRCGTRGLCPG